jgi:hypothetical protein
MRIFEIFADNVFKISLMEMAFERKVCIDTIRGLAYPISIHLVKVLAFDDEANAHWVKELDTFLEQVNSLTMKPKGKKLKGETYYSLLWDEPLNNGIPFITDIIGKLVRKGGYENCTRSSLTDAQIYEQCEKILHKVSYDIALNKYQDFSDYI